MKKIIVSFTTYPKRIKTINRILDCLTKQTILPDKIILYLSEEQFENKTLPEELYTYEKYGFEVIWKGEDLGSHKKYFYVMQEYPDDIVITVDDDFYYKRTLIEDLLKGYQKFPNAVIARRAAMITCLENGTIAPYSKWCECYKIPERYINTPRMDVFATTGGGTLFPPRVLKEEVYNKKNIMRYCRYADDIWIKVMQLLNNVPTVLVNTFFNDVPMKEYKETGLFVEHNREGGNDVQLADLLKIYDKYYGEKDKLTDRLFSGGRLSVFEAEVIFERSMADKANAYMRKVESYERVVIYGAGVIGRRVYRALEKAGIHGKVEAFVVNSIEDNPGELQGCPVRNYRNYTDEIRVGVIIGLLPEKQKEVIEELIQSGINEERITGLDVKTNMVLQEFIKQ